MLGSATRNALATTGTLTRAAAALLQLFGLHSPLFCGGSAGALLRRRGKGVLNPGHVAGSHYRSSLNIQLLHSVG